MNNFIGFFFCTVIGTKATARFVLQDGMFFSLGKAKAENERVLFIC